MTLLSSTTTCPWSLKGALIAQASRRRSSRSPRSSRTTQSKGSGSLGPIGLLVLLLIVALYLADDQFNWDLFASQTPTVTSRSTSLPSPTQTPSSGEPSRPVLGGIPAGLPASTVPAEVVSVADGDTIRVRISGEQYSVRLIGIDTPETYTTRTGYAECWGEEASAFTRSILTPGLTVYLERDRSDTDQYGRLVRYVWVDGGAVGLGEAGSAILFNEVLVRAGYAIPYPYYPDTREAARFAAAAKAAEREGIGIWCACGGERIPEEQGWPGCPLPSVDVSGENAALLWASPPPTNDNQVFGEQRT